jgi:hypothetical protein
MEQELILKQVLTEESLDSKTLESKYNLDHNKLYSAILSLNALGYVNF